MTENKFLSSLAFLSGCLPIAFIHFTKVIVIPFWESNENLTNFQFNTFVRIVSIILILLTISSTVMFYIAINKRFSQATTKVSVCKLKRKDLFSSGALSCYVVPFISLIGDSLHSTISIIILILLFLRVFTNNIMFLYTPMIDIFGYKILEGIIKQTNLNGQILERQCNIIVKSDSNLYFETDNKVVIEKLNETTFCAKTISISE